MKNRIIRVPKRVSSKLSEDKELRVILLLDESENIEEIEFKSLSQQEFFGSYSDSDSIYDNY